MPLFQNSVVSKQLQSQDKSKLLSQWNVFTNHFQNLAIQENIRNSDENQYQSQFLTDLMVNVFGYIKNPFPNFNLMPEKKTHTDNTRADGGIIIKDVVKAVIELKGMNTTDLSKIESQAFGYKNKQPNCNYVITSNFEKLRFYIDNATEYLEFNLFQLTQKEFELLYLCLAYDNIANDVPKKLKEQSATEEKNITKFLYTDYSLFKRELHQNLVALNPDFDALTLFKKSQKLLDRFLFIFFAEDRNLLPTNLIFRINKEWRQLQEMRMNISLYDRYKIYFNDLNKGAKVVLPAFSQTASHDKEEHQIFAYNGGLFQPDAVLDTIVIEDELLFTHTQKLSKYDFASEVDVNILGHIFENSLNELDEIKAQLEGTVIEKSATKRKKDGVFYTPKYITKYIVDNTVGKLCTDKKAELQLIEEDYFTDKKRTKATKQPLLEKLTQYRNWLLQITICDPACGSGAFLNQALDFLISEHRYIDELQAKLFGDALVLSDMEKSILENTLFGVDLNDESVEIAKLALWLRTAQPNRKLNDLNNNIKCGNSLIDDPEVAGDKAFNWQTSFPKVFEKGGFDVVIGNPPYVDIKQLNNIDVKYFFKNYKTCENRINLYSIFIEKGLEIIKDKGFLSYINPNSMLVNSSYFELRKYIINDLNKIIKLPDDVFEDAKVETIIFELIKNKELPNVEVINYLKNQKIDSIDNSKIIIFKKSNWIKDKNVNFNLYASGIENSIINKIEKSKVLNLEDISDFTLGITPYDKYKGHSKETIENREFHSKIKENEFYKPIINGENIKRFFTDNKIQEYIKYGDWLGAKRDERFFTNPRILIRQIVSGNPLRIYASYTEESLYFTQIGFGIISKIDKKFDNKYILILLNSTLLNFYHKYKFLDIEKNLFQKILIANCKKFPIKNISLEAQQPFIEKANQMLSLNKDLQEQSQKFQRTIQRKFELAVLPKKLHHWYLLSYADFIKELGKQKIKLSLSQEAEWEDYFTTEAKKVLALKSEIDTTDKAIDAMLYELYGLSEEEIGIVENS